MSTTNHYATTPSKRARKNRSRTDTVGGRRQQRRRIKKAGFPVMKTLDDFNYERLEHVSKALVWELAACDFIRNRQNIVMIGNSGAGKSHLSIGLGMNACYAGFNVKFYTAMNLANELAEAI